MATTKYDIKRWLERGKARGASHLVIVVDTFDYEDYPVYVMPGENVRATREKFDGPNMQKVMEIYDISMDWDVQLNEGRAFNY